MAFVVPFVYVSLNNSFYYYATSYLKNSSILDCKGIVYLNNLKINMSVLQRSVVVGGNFSKNV